MKELMEGYERFREKYFNGENHLYDQLVKFGQKPKAMIIACSDSRVDPSLILDCKPGELFVVRNVANLVPPYEEDEGYHGTSAALEFAICSLKIKHIILLGHTQCGGIQALVENQKLIEEKGFVGKWMALAKPALDKTLKENTINKEDMVDQCSKNALRQSLGNLKTFPWITDEIFLQAWQFNLANGKLDILS